MPRSHGGFLKSVPPQLCPRRDNDARIRDAVNQVFPERRSQYAGEMRKIPSRIVVSAQGIFPAVAFVKRTKYKIRKLLYDMLRYVLLPDTPISMRSLYIHASTLGYDGFLPVDRIKLVSVLLKLLEAKELRREFMLAGLLRHVSFRVARMGFFPAAYNPHFEHDASDVLSSAVEGVLRELAFPARRKNLGLKVLRVFESASKFFIDDPSQRLSSNFMVLRENSDSIREICKNNKDALNLFGSQELMNAKRVLSIRWTSHGAFQNFWVPVSDISHFSLGACNAFFSELPKVAFTEYLDRKLDFGHAVSEEFRNRIAEYFQTQLHVYKSFISFPVMNELGEVMGVANLNFENDELLLYDDQHIRLMWLKLRPLLTALAVCDKLSPYTGD